ncbi:MAG: hypothetical protein WBM63_13060, partial [Sedimenticolaceae bacterium]
GADGPDLLDLALRLFHAAGTDVAGCQMKSEGNTFGLLDFAALRAVMACSVFAGRNPPIFDEQGRLPLNIDLSPRRRLVSVAIRVGVRICNSLYLRKKISSLFRRFAVAFWPGLSVPA